MADAGRKKSRALTALAVVALGFAALAFAAPPSTSPAPDYTAPGRTGVVTLKDGSTLEGQITQANLMVSIKSRQGVEIKVTREMVVSIEYREETELEFNKRLRQLDKDDWKSRIALGKFCIENRRPDLARDVLIEALLLNPNAADASDLYETAKSQIEVDRRTRERAEAPVTPPASSAAPTSAVTPTTRPRNHKPTLSADQINLIRQAELREGDNSVLIRFENEVEKRFAVSRNMSLTTFRQLTPTARYFQIRQSGDAELITDVRIARDPVSLVEFRKLQGRILGGCASSGCHGGDAAGTFSLISPAENEAATYTNYYVLAKSSFDATRPNGQTTRLRMIDRTSPENSLLRQYALDPKLAQYAHPAVPNYRPPFRSLSDPALAQLDRWLTDVLSPLEPEYGFTFNPTPTPKTTTPSTTRPSTIPGASAAATP